jgi:glycosyltransferase involved in cell wall biosynthesis
MDTGIDREEVEVAMARADLHVHSKYSDRPSEWFLRRIGAPECFSEPEDIYRLCRARGMDFVTISDHNRLDGSLAIAHLPGAFLSSELTTYFPEDGCKVHCLVFGVTEDEFRDLQVARKNIYELREYMREHQILHSISHPLFRVNDILAVEHVEKLILMFDTFERINGTRHPRAGALADAVLGSLTPELIEEMSNRHNLAPVGEKAWVKRFTGGSDDHSGVYAASAYTDTPEARTVWQFLDNLRQGTHEAGGTAGTSLRLAHSLYHIAYSYYRSRFMGAGSGSSVIGQALKKLLDGEEIGGKERHGPIRRLATRMMWRRQMRQLSPIEAVVVEEFRKLRDASEPVESAAEGPDVRSFRSACRICHTLSYTFLRQFLSQVSEGRLMESLQSLTSLGVVGMGMAPYLTAFGLQHKDERFLQQVAARFHGGGRLRKRSNKMAWFTDTFDEINGVSHTIRKIGSIARERGQAVAVVTCLETPPNEHGVVNFQPLGMFAMPEYEEQRLAFPPFLEILDYLERGDFHEVAISTPGPMGLVGLLGARLLGLDAIGIYHTDWPRYVRCLTQDEAIEQLTWRYMHWFYGQMKTIYVPSEFYRKQLEENGFDAAKLKVLSRGVDVSLFTPERRDPGFWERYGLNGGNKVLYVGRVSREKNLSFLMHSFDALRQRDPAANLIVVGDGPDLESLRQQVGRNGGVVFTGPLTGVDLARAYASADIFVFPSVTDTFGNAVLEAQASGLPAIVSTEGGPAEIVRRNDSGLVVEMSSPDVLTGAMARLLEDKQTRRAMSERALKTAKAHTWDSVVEHGTSPFSALTS